jgi:antitoxin MazE
MYRRDATEKRWMTATLQRWGNSLGLRLPRPLLNQLGLREGAQVDLKVEGDRLVITRVSRRPSLQELMAGITAADRPGELEWGPPTGNEAW